MIAKSRKIATVKGVVVAISLLTMPWSAAGQVTGSGHTEVAMSVFQPAGPMEAGDVLVEGTLFPPAEGDTATLKRTPTCLEYSVNTSGLAPGAYTNWWVMINEPGNCGTPGQCIIPDVFNPATKGSAFWATGGVVQADGVGEFSDKICQGDDLGFPGEWMTGGDLSRCRDGEECTQEKVIGPQRLLGDGLTNPKGAPVWIILKYHGPASGDPVTLYDQTHTLLGSCFVGANHVVEDVQCFDPQLAFFPPKHK